MGNKAGKEEVHQGLGLDRNTEINSARIADFWVNYSNGYGSLPVDKAKLFLRDFAIAMKVNLLCIIEIVMNIYITNLNDTQLNYSEELAENVISMCSKENKELSYEQFLQLVLREAAIYQDDGKIIFIYYIVHFIKEKIVLLSESLILKMPEGVEYNPKKRRAWRLYRVFKSKSRSNSFLPIPPLVSFFSIQITKMFSQFSSFLFQLNYCKAK